MQNQGPDGDFAEQVEDMQTIFSNAYCVIAASSAMGASTGFLARNSLESVKLGDIFVSGVTNDFTRDVVQSPLNRRGWILQEHALARRTIFFTETQMYWECGDGVRCETLRKLMQLVLLNNDIWCFTDSISVTKMPSSVTRIFPARLLDSLVLGVSRFICGLLCSSNILYLSSRVRRTEPLLSKVSWTALRQPSRREASPGSSRASGGDAYCGSVLGLVHH